MRQLSLKSCDKVDEYKTLIVGELRGCGYSVRTKIFDAKGWVPQSRKRIYFVVGLYKLISVYP
jgi:site-specific DNA-cytosine methylase